MRKPSKTSIGIIILVIAIVGALTYERCLSPQRSIITLVTTTSTYDSGMLDYLMPIFESKYDAEVRIISVGTGRAIEIAKRGDADLILVHSRQLELEFVNSSYGIHRVGVMYNDFIIIGPINDPAGINGSASAIESFRRIADEGAKGNTIFISRADKSGTHMLELSIWKELGITPSSKTQTWYLEVYASMGRVLLMANEERAYTLTDRVTWISFKNQLENLVVLVQGDVTLLNPYAIILVNPEKHPKRNYEGALMLAKWIISEEGQKMIANFKKEGETLFKPVARDFEKACELGFPDQKEEIAWYDAQEF